MRWASPLASTVPAMSCATTWNRISRPSRSTTVAVAVTVVNRDGRLVQLQIVAHDADGTVLASGELQRVVVERDRFLSRLARPLVGD